MERISGVKAEFVLGKKATDPVPVPRNVSVAEFHRRALSGETFKTERVSVQFPHMSAPRYYEGHYSPIRNASGAIIGAVNAVRDITDTVLKDLRQAESWAEKRGEIRFRELLDSVPTIIWAGDVGGHNKFTNRFGLEFIGLDKDDADIAKWLERMHPDDVKSVTDAWVKNTQLPQPYEVQYRFKRASDGAYRWVLAKTFPILDQDGSVIEWMGTITDIHNQVLTSQRIENLQAITASLSSALTPSQVADIVLKEGVCALGADGGWVALLSADGKSVVTLSTLGYEDSSIAAWRNLPIELRLPLTDCVREKKPINVPSLEACIETYPLMAPAMASSETRSITIQPLMVENKVIGALGVSYKGPHNFDREGETFFQTLAGVCSHALDRSRIYDAERIARASAESANAAKSHFLANVSHEIRTPLCSIIGYADLLTKPTLTQEKRDWFVNGINRNGKALVRLVDDILDLSKIEAGHVSLDLVDVPLGSFLGEVVDLLRQEADRKGLSLEFTQSRRMPSRIHTDPFRLRQILLNIAGNAIKFTEEGSVSIDVSYFPRSASTPEQLRFRIEDTGIGMGKEALERLFRPFSQGHGALAHKYGGTGLGLVISRNLARKLGGEVDLVKSTSGKGSIFEIMVPVAMESTDALSSEVAPSEPSAERTASSASLAGRRILLAEDSVDVQQIIASLLIDLGAKVDPVNDGEQAIARALNNEYDLILMDLHMPNVDGYQAAAMLRARGYSRPILAITANALVDPQKLIDNGFNAYLIKPIEKQQFVQTITQLTSRSPVSADHAHRLPLSADEPV
jgi:PAS domain S-box-containing protein